MSWGQNTSTGGDTWAPAADNNPSPAQISGVISPDRAVETQYGIKDVFDLQQADGNVWSVFMPIPKRIRSTRSSRGVSEARTRVVVSLRFS